MLESLHVKNLALIEEQEVQFGKGLNILTGETGAGKSIIIGSINLALGAKADKEAIRSGAEYALVELVFSLTEEQKKQIKEMDLPIEEDGTFLLSRKLMQGKSVCRVGGELVSASQLKELSGILIDLYGQHEHQSLLKPTTYQKMLDDYARNDIALCRQQLSEKLQEYRQIQRKLEAQSMDAEQRERQVRLLSFEVEEIEAAGLCPEDEQVEKQYRRMSNARKIKETAYQVHAMTGYEGEESAGPIIGHALRELKTVVREDEQAETLVDQLEDIDSLLNDFNRSMAQYLDSLEFDEEEFFQLEERLNVLNHLKSKYGDTVEEIEKALAKKQEELQRLQNYEQYLSNLQQEEKLQKDKVLELCAQISKYRKDAALPLAEKLRQAMVDLNFLDVDFQIAVTAKEEAFTQDGYDQVEFLISTNPGESKRPLWQIASGGELSRIMLAFKTVLADKEETGTLIFDEIDTGISGKTAWKVAEKLGKLSRGHQVICITHLAQIAAMADEHFLIEKGVKNERTQTGIRRLSEQESLEELARLLGSGEMTKAVLDNAGEMRKNALEVKK